MDWKKINFSFKKNDKKETEEHSDKNNESLDFLKEKEAGKEEFNPKETDVKERNKKLVIVLSAGLFLLSFLAYYLNNVRTQNLPKQEKKESVYIDKDLNEKIEEDNNILALKQEIKELKAQVNEKNNKVREDEGLSGVPTRKKAESFSINQNNQNYYPETNNNSNIQPNNNQGSNKTDANALVFPNTPPPQEEKHTFKIVVEDNPFIMKSFNRGDIHRVNKNQEYAYIPRATDVSYSSQTGVNKEEKEKRDVKNKIKENKILIKTSKKKEKKKSKKFMIPSGSFFKVVLLNGVDALTGMGGKSNSYPVIARVLTDSVLPNRFFADMKGCFVLGVATGELSNERAIFRMDRLSCVTRNGKVLEKKITATIAGEDGKIGLIGRVVSKAGAQLGRTLLAKFVESAGQILSMQGQILTTGGGGITTTVKPSEAAKMALSSGFGGAAQSLANYYMKLADQIFPVIEINAGRQGDVMLLEPLVIDIDADLKDNGGFLEGIAGMGSEKESPEEKVFKVDD